MLEHHTDVQRLCRREKWGLSSMPIFIDFFSDYPWLSIVRFQKSVSNFNRDLNNSYLYASRITSTNVITQPVAKLIQLEPATVSDGRESPPYGGQDVDDRNGCDYRGHSTACT
ncbi:hypothetical protein T03_12042 [Trichinella britovi]|uniref:Uncharacterized protein n=1 Tax=Trichinella britovi TaxID=45882 RepID=A0A0V1CTH3_TRIBR|nr:hypothetical protein T03_12042 [Trichinella britovi]